MPVVLTAARANNYQDDYILNHQSLDGYLYLRYIKVIFFIFLIGCLITWPVLMPVNATATPRPSGTQQFDIVSYSASVNSPYRYFAHALIAYIFFGESTNQSC